MDLTPRPRTGDIGTDQEPQRDATLRLPAAETPSVIDRHTEELEVIRERVHQLQNRSSQLDNLFAEVCDFANRHYDERAVGTIMSVMNHIFQGEQTSRIFSVPNRFRELTASTPCVLTAFPGIGTHESIPQSDIVLTPRFSTVRSRSDVSLASHLLRTGDAFPNKLPIALAPMRSVIGEEMIEAALAQGITPVMHRFRRPLDPKDVDRDGILPTVQSKKDADMEKLVLAERYREKIFMSCGTSWESIKLAKRMMMMGVGGICVDVAIGNSEGCIATVLELKQFAKSNGLSTKIMAGNVDTDDGYYRLALAGADVIKVGIGPGSACTTRTVTRAGAGQGSALMSIGRAQFMMGKDAPAFIADGGIKCAADILIAMALGANGVMVGNLAARCKESGGLKRDINGKPHVLYFGEASKLARVCEDGRVKPGMAVEGDARWLPVTGTLEELLTGIAGGLRNAFPYYDAKTFDELRQRYSIPAQICRLILGETTGIYLSAPGHSAESRAHFGQ